MSDSEHLTQMLDSIVNDEHEQAEIHFHTYLQDKMKGIVGAVTNPEDVADVAAATDDVVTDDDSAADT